MTLTLVWLDESLGRPRRSCADSREPVKLEIELQNRIYQVGCEPGD